MEGTPPVENTEVNNQEVALPSVVEQNNEAMANFQFDEEFLKENVKDGKLFGRFDDIQGFLNTFKAVETKHANFVRDVKNGEKQTDAEIAQIQQDRIATQAKEEAISTLVPEIIGNGMELTDDIRTKAEDAGLDVVQLENQAMKAERVQREAFELVGGSENYTNMIAWAKENLSEGERAEFDSGLNSPFRNRLIKGLYEDFQKAGGEAPQPSESGERFSGDSAPKGIVGYATLTEMLKDKAHADGKFGTKADKEAFQKRLNRTSNAVLGIRG
jgi:hypothetical protein